MKLVVSVKLKLYQDQAEALTETLRRCNDACNWLSKIAWENQTFKQYDLHKLAYADLRERFALPAQMAVRCIAKVADSYKLDRKTQRSFRKHSAQPYDSRIIRICDDGIISIATLNGRIKVGYVCGESQRELLKHRKGEIDLMLIRGKFYLAVTCDVEEQAPIEIDDWLGVDLGIVNLAVDSDGEHFTGTKVEEKRRIYAHRRRNLQRKGTKSARRKLKRLAGRQARYQKDVNHCISKHLVNKAQRYGHGLAFEDLKGIRRRVKARRRQRAKHSNWGFHQLRTFSSYKALLSGVPLLLVDPRNTSRACPCCGHVVKENRRSRDDFQCVLCGHAGPADHIAARNIQLRARATVNGPLAAGDQPTLDV